MATIDILQKKKIPRILHCSQGSPPPALALLHSQDEEVASQRVLQWNCVDQEQ